MKSQLTDEIKELTQIRKQSGWSQQKLASELGIGISTVSRWERGVCKPGNLAIDRVKLFIKKNKQ